MLRIFNFGIYALLVAASVSNGQQDNVSSSAFVITTAPVKDGIRVTTDIPVGQQHRNIAGVDGAGLCVYSSVNHAAIWASVSEIYGFRDWMATQNGGSYPEKFDRTISQYCKLKGIPVPAYTMHTGGDETFIETALKTGRMVCVTYCGVDSRYGNQVIGHMVNVAYMDQNFAAVLDNNYIGTYIWMSRADFLARWRGIQTNGRPYMIQDGFRQMAVGGGWAIVLLNSPAAPYPDAPPIQFSASKCTCGDDCKCADKEKCPHCCPVLIGQCANGKCNLPPQKSVSPMIPIDTGSGQWSGGPNFHSRIVGTIPCNGGACNNTIQCPSCPGGVTRIGIPPDVNGQAYPSLFNCPANSGQCANGKCNLPPQRLPQQQVVPVLPVDSNGGQWIGSDGKEWGYWVGGKRVAAAFADGRVESTDANGIATGKLIDPPAPLPVGVGLPKAPTVDHKVRGDQPFPMNGVESPRLTSEKRWFVNGQPCSKEEAHAALSLVDDSNRWNLAVVGDPGFQRTVKDDVAKLSGDLASKLHVQTYAPDAWQTSQFKLSQGVTLRKPAVNRVGADVGVVPAGDYSSARLVDLLTSDGGPQPKPAPAPSPKPKDPMPTPPTPVPVIPVPQPMPPPVPVAPAPVPKPSPAKPLLILLLVFLAYYFLIRR